MTGSERKHGGDGNDGRKGMEVAVNAGEKCMKRDLRRKSRKRSKRMQIGGRMKIEPSEGVMG